MLVLELGFNLVTCFVHSVEFVDEVVVVASRLRQLLFHLIKVDLQSTQPQLKLILLDLGFLQVGFQLGDFLFAFAIDFREANHLSLAHLQLTGRVLQVFHQCLCLLFVDVGEFLSFL